MKLADLLTPSRVAIHPVDDAPLDKAGALHWLARMLGAGAGVDEGLVERGLRDREELQSTGIGEGIAIPHAALVAVQAPMAALVMTRGGVAFDAIDGEDVTLLLAVIGPKKEAGEQLRMLARISRVLRSSAFREELLRATDSQRVYDSLVDEEAAFVR